MATVTDLIRLYGSGLHVEVPDFDGQVVAGHHVASTVAELYIRDGWDDFRKEWAIVWILWLLKHLEKEKKGCMSLLYSNYHKLHQQATVFVLWFHCLSSNFLGCNMQQAHTLKIQQLPLMHTGSMKSAYIWHACHTALTPSCHTDGWCPCYCCTQKCYTGWGETLLLWSPPLTPPY